jgi:alginate O-acetyltransferase complex protein AlgI
MVFSSSFFLLYFLPGFLLAYYVVGRKYKNVVILCFSVAFYAWGAPRFIFVLLGTTFVDYHLVRWMDRSSTLSLRRSLLSLSVCMNVGLLFYFKYANFFIANFAEAARLVGAPALPLLRVILPVGISFYTFETITYVVDVYRRVHKPLHNFWDYQTYIILFPKLVAGPIVPYHAIADQITNREASETTDNRLAGFYRFCFGLGKKVLIANVVGAYADRVFKSEISVLPWQAAWIGILAFTFQIYFDFSGYSDMAIGIGRMIGFALPENFNNPYLSQSITEFWRRWHITLGAWMRNYLYIPLGGNRVASKGRLYANLWLVFLASGFWHGASWTFLFWGAYHGTFLILDRVFLLNAYRRVGRVASTLSTFFFVMIGWVFFRAEHFGDALRFIGRMFSLAPGTAPLGLAPDVVTTLVAAAFLSLFAWSAAGQRLQNVLYSASSSLRWHLTLLPISLALFAVSLASITASGLNPFIYFRF